MFCRNSDDCTTAYATRKGFSGSTRNVRMRNSTLWADVAHPIFIGMPAGPRWYATADYVPMFVGGSRQRRGLHLGEIGQFGRESAVVLLQQSGG